MTEQSAQLQAVEQALQDKGIDYELKDAFVEHLGGEVRSTEITVEVYDTGDV